MKRALAVLSAVCISIGLISCGEEDSPFVFQLNADGRGYTLSSIGTFAGEELFVPSEYDGKPVTKIGERALTGDFAYADIPDSVTEIGFEAFADCKNLKEIDLGNGVVTIGASAFIGCEALEYVYFSNALQNILATAFKNCYSLRQVELPEGVKRISGQAFADCDSLTEFTVPASVETMGKNVFSEADSLREIYCKADGQPTGWDVEWCEKNMVVYWGENNTGLDHTCAHVVLEYKEPTCQEEGFELIGCTYCGEEYDEAILPTVDCEYGRDGVCKWCGGKETENDA